MISYLGEPDGSERQDGAHIPVRLREVVRIGVDDHAPADDALVAPERHHRLLEYGLPAVHPKDVLLLSRKTKIMPP